MKKLFTKTKSILLLFLICLLVIQLGSSAIVINPLPNPIECINNSPSEHNCLKTPNNIFNGKCMIETDLPEEPNKPGNILF